MAFNDFTGHSIMAPSGVFVTPGEKALGLLKKYETDVTLYLGTSLNDIVVIQWGDEAGPLNNMVASVTNKVRLRKLKNFEKDLCKTIESIPDIFPNFPVSALVNSHSAAGLKIDYEKTFGEEVSAVKINGIHVVKLTFTTPPGPAADWSELFTYLIVKKADEIALVEHMGAVYDNHRKAPSFHTIGARGSSHDIDLEPYSWDRVILDPSVVKLLKNDFESFFQREEWFKAKKLPFRRGYLLHGDPGNGKTSAIKAMMWAKRMDAYTLSFFDKSVGLNELNTVFESAAERAPSMVVLEDIDRAFPKSGSKCAISLQELLNAIDGIGTKEGIITIATANNPSDLDPAILKRPGRFDRTIKFENPNKDLREKYYVSKDPTMPQDEAFKEAIVQSAGYSFAQLQESYILAGQHAYDEGTDDINGEQLLRAVKALAVSNSGVKKPNTVGF